MAATGLPIILYVDVPFSACQGHGISFSAGKLKCCSVLVQRWQAQVLLGARLALASSCGAFLCSFFLCGTLSCCFFGVARSCVRALPLCLVLTDLYYQLGFKHLCSFYIVWQALVLFGAYLLYQQLGFKLLCSFC
jgi:hypothetical protein